MDRRVLFSLAFVCLFTILMSAGCEEQTAKETGMEKTAAVAKRHSNIILVLTSDQRWDTLGCAGNSIIQTPNIDKLAQSGTRFSNAFVTTSMGASSRAGILTGQWSSQHGIIDNQTPLSQEAMEQTYPVLLRKAGFRTGFVGKYGIGTESDLPVNQYDFWRGFADNGRYENKDSGDKYKHLTKIIQDEAVEFLQSCTKDQPFCLSISFKAPQAQENEPRQYIYDPIYKDLYQDVSLPLPETTQREYFENLPEFLQESENRRQWYRRFLTPDMTQESIKNYYRLITGVDDAVGKIREQLLQLNLEDNTVIIFTSDSGCFLGEYGLAEKWFPYEVSIRVPLIILDPKAAETMQGSTIEQMALNVDIASTILQLAGLTPPTQMQGKSLLALIQGNQTSWRTDFFYENMYEHRLIPRTVALRNERYKYIRYIDYEYEELYDLTKDPGEAVNIATEDQKILNVMSKRCNELANEAKVIQYQITEP
jgi:arylsulfatase A-like enzyme